MKYLMMILQIKALILSTTLALAACNTSKPKVDESDHMVEKVNDQQEGLETITLGGGCFWCVEAVFEELNGVVTVESGYSGGLTDNPTYKQICTGTTGHAEVTQIKYDPDVVDLETILEVFWTTHDPTTLNKQGYDVGTQYRSIILYETEEQKSIAEKSKKEVAPQLWDDPIVTEITAFEKFYPAEEDHQDFYELNPNYGYCRAVINPKMEKFRKRFSDKLKN